ncbi:MAG: HAMP domain-containing protein [Dactylosporangium sp.]|nr:HAMP domain-containing protein [Dactylosporangium sp.]NNJ61295.1 HAMP domain-containing protein [Dactylosporangium sp.]
MRWTLARLTLAVTSMVALAFLIPLAVLSRQIVAERAIADARAQATSMVAVLAVSEEREVLVRGIAATGDGAAGRLAVSLPEQPAVGVSRADAEDLTLVRVHRRAVTAPVAGGLVYLQPVAIDGARTAVVEVYVPAANLHRGVATTWLSLAGLAIVLVAGSVLVADRLGARPVAAARHLAGTVGAFGAGDLSARVRPAGPPELVEAGRAFNAMADRLARLIAAERELAADLSHRLHTPLTALRLDSERLPAGGVGGRVRDAVLALEDEIEAIIAGARQPANERSAEHPDLVEVLADRLAFWSVLAEDHDRPWQVVGADRPIPLAVPRTDLIGAVDALLGNVFEHTPQGTAFRITVSDQAFVVEDAGPGIADTATALRRGVSGSGSTGLGLDIARRVTTSLGGNLWIDRGELGGARVAMLLTPGPSRP